MKTHVKVAPFTVLAFLLFSCNTWADNHYSEALIITPSTHPNLDETLHICEYAGTERSISLSYDKTPPLPCQVTYYREQEGKPFEILWSAEFDEGFCEAKTEELLNQLREAGWICTVYADT